MFQKPVVGVISIVFLIFSGIGKSSMAKDKSKIGTSTACIFTMIFIN